MSNFDGSRRDIGGIILNKNIPEGLYPIDKSISETGPFIEGYKLPIH